jgi:uncharacterized protein (DUF488 family)
MVKLFLTGYEKEDFNVFLKKIDKLKIKALIDVREIPLSRKNGFSRVILEGNLNELGVTYYHFPELGSPKKIREALYLNGDYLTFFTEYRKYINKEGASIRELKEVILEEKTSALFCYEKDYELCHRSIITDEILKMIPKIVVTPI